MKREDEIAMVFLETHGTTMTPPSAWHRWAHAERGYCPEWLSDFEPDECVTVLDYSHRVADAPDGYRCVYQHTAGERACPYCGYGTGYEHLRSECSLCEGDGLIYQGEECKVVVFQKIPEWEQVMSA